MTMFFRAEVIWRFLIGYVELPVSSSFWLCKANLTSDCHRYTVKLGQRTVGRSLEAPAPRRANGKDTLYQFDGAGNPLRIVDVKNLTISASYNNFGHRTQVIDPSRGTWNFVYNGFGEVTKQCDARVTVGCQTASAENFVLNIAYDSSNELYGTDDSGHPGLATKAKPDSKLINSAAC